MLLGEILQKTTDFFKEKKIESARLDTELLLANVLGLKRIELYIKFEYLLTEDEIQRAREFVRRRSQGEPIAYILEKKDFYNETFLVRKGVLIPRPETEGIVEEVLSWVHKTAGRSPLSILDLGFGSGCIGLSLAKSLGARVTLTGIDVSEVAVEVATENAKKLEVDQVQFFKSRIQDFNFEQILFDIIVANPPYISKDDRTLQASVKAFEPPEALFAEEDGLKEIADWALASAKILCPQGFVAFEIGSTQAEKVKKIFSDTGQFISIRSEKDLAGHDRYIFAEKS